MIYQYPHPEYFQDWEKPDFEKLSKPLILWGAGKIGGVAAHCLKKRGVEYEAFCDIAADKWGTQFCGHIIVSPEDLQQQYPDATVIITAICYIDIYEMLQKMGIRNVYDGSSLFMKIDFSGFDFWTSEEYAIRNIEQYLAGILEQKTRAGTIDQVYLHITTRCSLRCKECAVLIPYIKHPENYSADMILTDFKRVIDSLQHVRVVNFYGGEPMLHPDLARMIRYLKHEDRIDQISIITNGTILPNQDVLQAMRDEPRFLVRISDYGKISGKVHEIVEALEQYGIRYEITNYAYWDRGTTIQKNNYTKEQLVKKFRQCTACNVLHVHNSRAYLCCTSSAACTMGVFPESQSNYIDLTDEKDLAENLRWFVTKPGRGEYMDACQYCSGIHCIQFEDKVPVAVQTKELLKFPKLI